MKKNTIEIILLTFLLIFSGSKIMSKYWNYYKDSKFNDSITSQYKDITETIDTLQINNVDEKIEDNVVENRTLEDEEEISNNKNLFTSLKKRNSDFKGWIKINGTNINYPFVQTTNNNYYLRKNIDKNKSVSGTIFADYRVDIETSDNYIIYGHHMKDGTMFRDIVKYKKDLETNNIITIETDTNIYFYQVFSAYYTDINFKYLKTDFESKEEYEKYLNTIKNKSLNKSNIEVTTNDKIITLSTCSYEFKGARTAVHGKLIKNIVK